MQGDVSMDIFDYAHKKEEKDYLTYAEACLTLLAGYDCVIAKESIADLLGYSNGGYRDKITIYTTKLINEPYLNCILVNNYDKLNVIDHRGIHTTTINQAIVDMLEDNNIDSQILLETLANYYFENNKSFKTLEIPKHLQTKFNKYAKESIKYYEN